MVGGLIGGIVLGISILILLFRERSLRGAAQERALHIGLEWERAKSRIDTQKAYITALENDVKKRGAEVELLNANLSKLREHLIKTSDPETLKELFGEQFGEVHFVG